MPELDGHPYEIWDVFTDTPLQGNPLAVFPHAEEIPSRLFGPLARELNLSETVFILPDDPAEADASLRIFTPSAELPYAGHPTLGAAFVVAGADGQSSLRLRTGMGVIALTMTRDGEGGELTAGEMEQPVPSWDEDLDTGGLLGALGLRTTSLPVTRYTNGPQHVVVGVEDRETLSTLVPDLRRLAALGPQGVAVIAPGPADTIYTRNFCPGLGVAEDPATGSAAGPIAVHLMRHERVRSGAVVHIVQGVEIGRPSRLEATAYGDAKVIDRVTVAGSAVQVASGFYRLA